MIRKADIPLGIAILAPKYFPKSQKRAVLAHRLLVLALTYFTSMGYHISRKSFSAVKTVLHRNCSEIEHSHLQHPNGTTWCSWEPFDGDNYSAIFSGVDSAFLFSYGLSMFVSGIIAERVNLRYFITVGQFLTAILVCMLGLAYTWKIHSLTYFIVIQVLFGVAQSTGWPAAVAVCGNWFGKKKPGLLFGIWNSHLAIGHILGSVIGGRFLESNWALSFIVPGLIMMVVDVFVFLFLVTNPEDVGCKRTETAKSQKEAVAAADSTENQIKNEKAIGFFGAFRIPGVIAFSFTLFFVKLVQYTFLFWLPRYIKDSTTLSAELSSDLSTFFDVGGFLGAIVTGIITDITKMPGATCSGMLIWGVPSIFLYQLYGTSLIATNIILLLLVGAFVNGTSTLIATAVSAQLGTHESIQGNAKALATVIAIIDGTGSVGSAVGPLLAGLVSPYGWQKVFYLLIGSNVIALLCLGSTAFREIKEFRSKKIAKKESEKEIEARC